MLEFSAALLYAYLCSCDGKLWVKYFRQVKAGDALGAATTDTLQGAVGFLGQLILVYVSPVAAVTGGLVGGFIGTYKAVKNEATDAQNPEKEGG